jgi:fructose transport system ATP-binding protein
MTATQDDTRAPVLQADNMVKVFGRVVGLAGVSLKLYPGEVLAVIGDNGAGKSTLIKCLSGAMAPDEGTMRVQGREVSFKSTAEARKAGIECVYQTLAVAPALDIASNLFLAREQRKAGFLGSVLRMLDTGGMKDDASKAIKDLGITTLQNVNQAVETLSGGQRQAVAVARAGAFGSQVVILDEPTAALGVRETGQVLDVIRDLRNHNVSVVVVSHNMQQLMEIADRITVMRLGRTIATRTVKETKVSEIVGLITGAIGADPEEETATVNAVG